tara:strand:- start:716 stop:1126 length:411 start_codon:yes stop_codon:yes gene_type:complete
MPSNITVLGRLTDDPEIRQTKAGKDLASFSVADNYGKDKVLYHNCVVFDDRLTNFAKEHLNKGSNIFVSGRLEDDSFQNKEGVNIKRVKIVVNGIDFAPGAKSQDGNSGGGGSNSQQSPAKSDSADFKNESDEIPF